MTLTFTVVLVSEIAVIAVLSLLPRLGNAGASASRFCTHAPGLDFVLALLIWIPWIISVAAAGWSGLLACLGAQFVCMQGWILTHEAVHRSSTPEQRIVGFLNKRFGWWRNNLALWVTSAALPVFFLLRLAEVALYPCLVILLGFRSYDQREWVNISRQKFQGLVGHDLIWCLYCDWMTGVYSLGSEMLRNVESFWCPIRFYDRKKCENCQIDFPDIDNGWVSADGKMADVVQLLEENTPTDQPWTWLNHPDRQRS